MTIERQPTPDEQAGIDWWNAMSEAARDSWLRIAESARPADAWEAYKRTRRGKRAGPATWEMAELVAWGIESCGAAAARQAHPYIFVSEIYAGATRMSAQTVAHACVLSTLKEIADGMYGCKPRAYVILRHKPETGWYLSDFANVRGDRAALNAQLAKGFLRREA